MPDDQADHKQDAAAETEVQTAEEPETEAHRHFRNEDQPDGVGGSADEPETEAHSMHSRGG